MIIDLQTFTELTLHLRLASDGLLDAARPLAALCQPDADGRKDGARLSAALDSLCTMNKEFVVLEGLVRAVWEANRNEGQLPI